MILGVDIGGTSVKIGLVSREGRVYARREADVSFDGYKTPVLTTVIREAAGFLKEQGVKIEGIGVSATGQVDDRMGVVIGTNGKFLDTRAPKSSLRCSVRSVCPHAC